MNKQKLKADFFINQRFNHVCIDCRFNSKRNANCPKCRKPMVAIGYKWRIPKKNDDKGWARVESVVRDIISDRIRKGYTTSEMDEKYGLQH